MREGRQLALPSCCAIPCWQSAGKGFPLNCEPPIWCVRAVQDVGAFDKALGTVSFVILIAELVAGIYAVRSGVLNVFV